MIRFCRSPEGSLRLAEVSPAGRSGYLHRNESCWSQFAARKGMLRSLRFSVERPQRAALIGQIRKSETVVSLG